MPGDLVLGIDPGLATVGVALVNGAVVARGTATEVLNDQTVVEAFLGGSEAAIQRSGHVG